MKKLLAILLAAIMLLSVFATTPFGVSAATNLPNSIFIQQATDYTCTLASATMMLRARTYLANNSTWSSITEASVSTVGWYDGVGLSWNFSYSSGGNTMKVNHTSVGGMSLASVKDMLNSHPEGFVLYCGNIPHAILVTDYDGDTLYCADSASGYAGSRRTLASSLLGRKYGSQAAVLNNTTAYWYISSATQPIIIGNDTQAPVLTDVKQKNNSDNGFTLNFTVSDNVALKYVAVYIKANGVFKEQGIDVSGKQQEVNYDINYSDFGTNTGFQIGIWVYDTQSNLYQSPWLDFDEPIVFDIRQKNISETGFTLSFNVSDNTGLEYVAIYIKANGVFKEQGIEVSGKQQEVNYDINYSDFGTNTGFQIGIWVYDTLNNLYKSPWIEVNVVEDPTVSSSSDSQSTESTETQPSTDKQTEPTETQFATDKSTEPIETQPATDKSTDPTETHPIKIDINKWDVTGIKNMTYTGKVLKQNDILVYQDGEYADFNVKYKNNVNVGTATVTIIGIGDYTGTIVKTYKITKADNPMTVKAKKTGIAKSNKKTKIKKAITVKNAQGKVSYITNNKKVTIKNGTIIIAKGLKKGKTIKVKITVTAMGNNSYNSKKIVKTIKIKIK